MSDTENKGAIKSFYYRHHNGTLINSQNGILRFIRTEGHSAGFFYSLILEHLTSMNNRSDIDSIVKYFWNTDCNFDDEKEVKRLIDKCPDIGTTEDRIYSNYLEFTLREKLKGNLSQKKKSGLGTLVNNFQLWRSKEDYTKISQCINRYKDSDLTSPKEIESMLNYKNGLKELKSFNKDGKYNNEVIDILISVEKKSADNKAKK